MDRIFETKILWGLVFQISCVLRNKIRKGVMEWSGGLFQLIIEFYFFGEFELNNILYKITSELLEYFV